MDKHRSFCLFGRDQGVGVSEWGNSFARPMWQAGKFCSAQVRSPYTASTRESEPWEFGVQQTPGWDPPQLSPFRIECRLELAPSARMCQRVHTCRAVGTKEHPENMPTKTRT